jgi:hypothetical protein
VVSQVSQCRGKPFPVLALDGLRGMVLGCWCAPQLCHGHVLVDALAGRIVVPGYAPGGAIRGGATWLR